MVSEAKEKIISSIINCIEKNCMTNKTDALTLQIEKLSNSFGSYILRQALLDLNDLNDTSYIILKDKLSSLNYFCNEIIIVYTLKLRLSLNVNTNEIPDDLKKLFYKSFKMQNSSDTKIFLTGSILSNLCYEILDILISMDLFILDNFIKIEEVNDLYTALLYEHLYKKKCLKKCPNYIKDVSKLSYINDKLVSIDGWIIYFNKKSLSSIKKDIDLLRNYQFDDFQLFWIK